MYNSYRSNITVRRTSVDIQIDRQIDMSLIDQIVKEIKKNIDRGILKPGSQLPSIRIFSKTNNVSHVTVSKAYKKLEKIGLIELVHGKGAFVKNRKSSCTGYATVDSFDRSNWLSSLRTYVDSSAYTSINKKRIRFDFSEAIINPKLLPSDYLAEKVNQTLISSPKIISSYGLAQGEQKIRENIKNYIEKNGGFETSISNMIITSGVQQGIDIVAKAFIGPGDIVLVEESSYVHALEVFSSRGAKIIAVPMDEYGLKINKLHTLCLEHKPKLVYTIPTFHNPTGVTLSLTRRKQLLNLARDHQFLIVEDDSWSDIYFDDKVPPPAIKSLDKEGCVIYLKGFSKYLSPGCRIGVIIPSDIIFPHLLASKLITDLGSPILTQQAASSFFNTNRMDDHLIKLRTALEIRRNQFILLLEKHLPSVVKWSEPTGGLNIWLTLPSGTDTLELLEEAVKKGISFLPGSFCDKNGKKSRHLRLSFSYIDTSDIVDGLIELCKIIKSYLDHFKSDE